MIDLCGTEELQLLEEQARIALVNTPDSAHFIEVGVFQGGSAHRLNKVRKGTNRRLYLVDDMSLEGANREEWPQGKGIIHLDSVEQLVMIRSFEGFAVLHQDAYHTAPVLFRHLKRLGHHVVPGGIIALHDYWSQTYSGVQEAWKKWPFSTEFHSGGRAGSLQIWVRDE